MVFLYPAKWLLTLILGWPLTWRKIMDGPSAWYTGILRHHFVLLCQNRCQNYECVTICLSFVTWNKGTIYLPKLPPPSAVPRAQGWDRSRPSSCSLAPHSVFITEEAIHLSSEQVSLQWATDGPRTANRIWRLSLLCYSSEAGPAGERLKGITVYQLWEIDEGIYSALHFISPATFPALSAFFANVLWESELFSPSGTAFQAEVEPCWTRMLCCSSYVIKLSFARCNSMVFSPGACARYQNQNFRIGADIWHFFHKLE